MDAGSSLVRGRMPCYKHKTNIGGSYKLTWTIKLLATSNATTNVFRFTKGNANLQKHGDRIIALFLGKNKVHLVVETAHNKNWHINSDTL